MGTVLSFFDTTSANIVADLKAKILLSSDWSNPSGNRVVCTTTRGADMVVDLADAAAQPHQMQLGVYRTAALADKIVRYIIWRQSGGSSTNPLHVTVSVGKEHLWITIEGPRAGEPNAVLSTSGSYRGVLYLGDLIPYFSNDTVPAVVLVAMQTSGDVTPAQCRVSRNRSNSVSWEHAKICSFEPPHDEPASTSVYNVTRLASNNSKMYLFPFVLFEDVDGLRGRLNKIYNMGFAIARATSGEPSPAIFSRVSYDGETFILLPTSRPVSLTTPTGFGTTGSTIIDGNTVVAVPWSA